nr:MAG TPA: hypothetical protein [Caudoviricetes sp.]
MHSQADLLERLFLAGVQREGLAELLRRNGGKAEHRKVGCNIRQFQRQQVHVPLRQFSDLVVHKAECFDLLRRQIIGNHAGNRFKPQLLRRFIPGVARNDLMVRRNDQRHQKAILPDALGHSSNCLLIFARVLLIRVDFSDRKRKNVHRLPPKKSAAAGGQQALHHVVLRIAHKGHGAVLLYNIEQLVPQQICLLLKRLTHLDKRACNGSACSRVFAQQAIGADGILALDIPGESLCVGFQQPGVNQLLTAAGFQPAPCFREDFICTQRLPVALPGTQIFAGVRHVLSQQVRCAVQSASFQFRRVKGQNFRLAPGDDLICKGIRLISGTNAPAAPVGSVFCHVISPVLCILRVNTLFELPFFRAIPHARCTFRTF